MSFMPVLSFLFIVAVANCNMLNTHSTQIRINLIHFPGDVRFIYRAYAFRDDVVEDIMIRLYNGKTVEEYVEIKLSNSEQILSQSSFHMDKMTVFYVHGYKELASDESIHTVVTAYLNAKPYDNIVLIDWSNMAMGNYFFDASPNTRKVAYSVAQEIKKLIDRGLSLDRIHIVGHSLGGQIAGFIGKEMKKMSLKLKRISALDPAFPMFFPGIFLGHIKGDDADFVDIIHTDAGFYGYPFETGTVNFWPNRGKRTQPGCTPGFHEIMSAIDLCSHWRSWRFWAESVEHPNNFPATKDNKIDIVYMGYAADINSRGNYNLKTSNSTPFGLGMDGIV